MNLPHRLRRGYYLQFTYWWCYKTALVPWFINRRVSRGVQLLTQEMPNWPYKVDVDKLDMSHPHNCVLGQVFGDYDDARIQLGIAGAENWIKTCQLGFTTQAYYEDAALRDAWIERIALIRMKQAMDEAGA